MKKFITNLTIVPMISSPILLLRDDNGVIVQEKEPRSHQKSKHILRCFHVIREIFSRGDLVVKRVLSTENIVHLWTRPLDREVS